MPREVTGSVTVPNTFTPATVISSAQVNANHADAAAVASVVDTQTLVWDKTSQQLKANIVLPFPETFTQAGTGAVARPWVSKMREVQLSIADFGAVPDGVTDNATAIANAYARIVAMGGGEIIIPEGSWATSSFPTINISNVMIRGRGMSSRLLQTSTTGDFLSFQGGLHCEVRDLFFGATVRKTSGFAIKFDLMHHARLANIVISHHYNGVHVNDCAQFAMDDFYILYLLGTVGLNNTGTAGRGLFGATYSRGTANNPIAINTVPKTWAQSTAFSVGDAIFNNGNVYQCSTSGMSAASGTGPAGLPAGTDPESAFSGTIADGTCQWKFLSNTLTWMVMGSYTFSLRVIKCALLNGYTGFAMVDNANTGTSYPRWVDAVGLECDSNYASAASLVAGAGFTAVNSWFSSCRSGRGITATATYKGDIEIVTSKIINNYLQGALFNAGPVNTKIINSRVGANSVVSSGLHPGILFAANATDFIVTGNKLGTVQGLPNQQSYGAVVAAGASDRYVIANNLVSGNVTGVVSDGGTGVNKAVANNF